MIRSRSQATSSGDRFRKALAEAVNEGLLTLEPDARNMIRYYAENRRVKLEDVPEKIDIFCNILKAMMGAGGRVVEEATARSLYSKLALEFTKRDNWRLTDHIENAKKLISERE